MYLISPIKDLAGGHLLLDSNFKICEVELETEGYSTLPAA